MVTPSIISIPQGRTDLIPKGYEIVDKRVVEFADFPAPKFDLFPEQRVVYDEVDSSCFINALVGWGKTFTALHIAHKLGMKTLVVTHTTALRDQWAEEVEKLYGFKPSIIGGGNYSSSGPIVVGNIQSLVKQVDRIAKEYGTIIMDEAHHTPATTFTNLINECHARYRIALSGTMTRKDGKHILFRDYFGDKIFKPPQNNTVNPTVKLLKTHIKLPPGPTWADRVTNLLSDKEYQDLIASMALVQARKGHKVLVIADRVNFLQNVSTLLEGRAALVIGETVDRKAELEKVENGQCDIICGSRQIFSEGISLNSLSCVILAIPISNPATLEQIIGRVMRLSPGKLDPVVIDLQFAGSSEKKQNSSRIGLYLEKGWKMEQI
jgi:superfamily II DNA or RNA helicase